MAANYIRSVLLLALCGASASAILAQDACQRPRTISVVGTAEVKVAPDEVDLTIGIDSHDKDLVVAKTNEDQRMKRLIALARAAGVEEKNIKTNAVTMGPEYSDEKTPRLLGYRVSETVLVELTDISKYEDLMTNFLKAGVNRVEGIDFAVGDPKKYRDEARLKAIRAAQEKARTMAAELAQSLGKPWEVIEDADEGMDLTRSVNANATVNFNVPLQQEAQPLAGGEMIIRATVRVTFQLE